MALNCRTLAAVLQQWEPSVLEVAPADSRTYLHDNPRQESALGPSLKAVLRVGSVA